MYNRSTLFVSLLLCLIFAASNADTANDCGEPETGVPRFTQLAVFPNPVQVGQAIHIRAVVLLPELNGQTLNGSLTMEIKYAGHVEAVIPAISLCDSTSSIMCSKLTTGENAISFDYNVPNIPAGSYDIKLTGPTSSFISAGCVAFKVKVTDPSQSDGKYKSWLQAQLASTAYFANTDYTKRQLNDTVQIGPIGPVTPTTSYVYPWGTFISVTGTQDNVLPNINTYGLVWGLSGRMNAMTYSKTQRTQTYSGSFYVGYVDSYAKRALDVPAFDGDFVLTWTYTVTPSGVLTTLSGKLTLGESAVLPKGWSNPLIYGRLAPFVVSTSSEGVLTVSASENICTSSTPCDFSALTKEESQKTLSNAAIGIIIAFVVGLPMIVGIVVATGCWLKRRRIFEEEDGIFSASRKPEYGNALVVDDIIQETREHSPELANLRLRPGDYSDEEFEERGRRSRRSSRRMSRNSISRSRTPSRSDSVEPSERSRSRSADSRSDSYSDDYSSDGSSASRF